jgi:hypothetical protein
MTVHGQTHCTAQMCRPRCARVPRPGADVPAQPFPLGAGGALSPSARALHAHAPGQSLPQGLAAGYSRMHAQPAPPPLGSPGAGGAFGVGGGGGALGYTEWLAGGADGVTVLANVLNERCPAFTRSLFACPLAFPRRASAPARSLPAVHASEHHRSIPRSLLIPRLSRTGRIAWAWITPSTCPEDCPRAHFPNFPCSVACEDIESTMKTNFPVPNFCYVSVSIQECSVHSFWSQ